MKKFYKQSLDFKYTQRTKNLFKILLTFIHFPPNSSLIKDIFLQTQKRFSDRAEM
jgi:hypothetical protein